MLENILEQRRSLLKQNLNCPDFYKEEILPINDGFNVKMDKDIVKVSGNYINQKDLGFFRICWMTLIHKELYLFDDAKST